MSILFAVRQVIRYCVEKDEIEKCPKGHGINSHMCCILFKQVEANENYDYE